MLFLMIQKKKEKKKTSIQNNIWKTDMENITAWNVGLRSNAY